jgi:alkaline phosphatase D
MIATEPAGCSSQTGLAIPAFTLETRHTARAKQIDYRHHEKAITTKSDAERLVRDVLGAPGRALLAGELEAELETSLRRSVAARQPWRLIGNPIPIARTRVPDVAALGLMPDPLATPGSSSDARDLAWKGKWNLPFYPDTWDGYDWAREQLYALSRRAGAGDLVFLTGDSHSFWANRLADAKGRPAGIELGTAGITSPGDFVESGFGNALSRQLDRAFEAHNPEVVWTDNMHQGYVRLVLNRTDGQAAFVAVDTVLSSHYRTATIKRFAVSRKGRALQLREGVG